MFLINLFLITDKMTAGNDSSGRTNRKVGSSPDEPRTHDSSLE